MGRVMNHTKKVSLPVTIDVSEDGVRCGACKLWTMTVVMNGRTLQRRGGYCTAFEKHMVGDVTIDCLRLPECLAATKEG